MDPSPQGKQGVYVCSHPGCMARIRVNTLAIGDALFAAFKRANWELREPPENARIEGSEPAKEQILAGYCIAHGSGQTIKPEGSWLVAHRCGAGKRGTCKNFLLRTPDNLIPLSEPNRRSWMMADFNGNIGVMVEPLCPKDARRVRQAHRG